MSRPLRIEFPGAVYHVTSRGDRREPIFVDDADRHALLGVLEQAMDRFDAEVLAYCLMGNHYHFVLHTRMSNLSRVMRHLNGVYTQDFNRRHGNVGHLFQGRFKAVLVDRDAYLLEVCRYVELNPVRARMVKEPGDWVWSSYRAHIGEAPTQPWLDTAGLHGYLLGQAPAGVADARRAARRYAALVAAGRDVELWPQALRQQVYLGDESFVQRMQQQHLPLRKRASREVPRAQRSLPMSAATVVRQIEQGADRGEVLRAAYVEGGLTMTVLAAALGLSVSRVSRLIAGQESARPQRAQPA